MGDDLPMSRRLLSLFVLAWAFQVHADNVLFRDSFGGKLQEGWSWRRENKAGWRVERGALRIRVEPGNMWGGANDAKNVLVRALPSDRPLELSATVSNKPTEQYEQVDLVCYYDDSHMVKIGFERVDGQPSVVMGREENDKTHTIAIIPTDAFTLNLRLIVDSEQVRGMFRPADSNEWREAGVCSLPSPNAAKLSIQCYQGPSGEEHWAAISDVTVRALDR